MNVKICLAVLIACFLAGLPLGAQSKLNVITTTEDLAAIAREVGGDHITVESIARGYQDPHFVEAKPSFILKMQKANILILVGRELEIGWLPPLIQQSRNSCRLHLLHGCLGAVFSHLSQISQHCGCGSYGSYKDGSNEFGINDNSARRIP